MSQACDGCGKPIGHADEICVEYKEQGIRSFGRTECKIAFEDAKDAVPVVRCDHCSDFVEKEKAEEVEFSHNQKIMLVGKVHPECREEFFNQDDIYRDLKNKTGDQDE